MKKLILLSFLVLILMIPHGRTTAANWENISPAGLNLTPPNGGALSVAIDPAHPGTIYVGTDMQGIYKSTNSGVSWTHFNPSPGPCGGPLFDGRNLALVVDETGAVYTTNDYGCAQGIFKSIDGGVTWTSLLPPGMPTPDVGHIALDPYLAGHILASLHSNHNCPDNCDVPLYESFDHGATWTVTPIVPGTGWQQWVFFGDNSDSWIVESTYTGIFRTTNHGTTWTQVATTPGNATTMVKVAGAYYLPSFSGIYRSFDGGATWSLAMCSCSPYPVQAVAYGGGAFYSRIDSQMQSGPMRTSTDGVTWVNQAQTFVDGPIYMANDGQYIYAAMLNAGVWRLPISAGPTPTPGLPTATPQPSTATPTPISATPTSTPTPAPTQGSTRQCTVRWGSTTVSDFGQLTQTQCAAIGH